MRPQKIETAALLERLMQVLKSKGYEGASLNDLASASGLKKASLYHRFPGGKKDIVMAVLVHADQWLNENVFAVLQNSAKDPSDRLKEALLNTKSFYNDGDAVCIIRALSLETGLQIFGSTLKVSVEKWLASLEKVGLDMGMSEEAAKHKALQSLILIQGSLVVAKATASKAPFLSSIEDIEKMYKQL